VLVKLARPTCIRFRQLAVCCRWGRRWKLSSRLRTSSCEFVAPQTCTRTRDQRKVLLASVRRGTAPAGGATCTAISLQLQQSEVRTISHKMKYHNVKTQQ